MGESSSVIDSLASKIALSKSDLEKTRLYHEMGKAHMEMQNYNHAKSYGLKSLAAANKAKDESWKLQATLLISQAQGMLKRYPQTCSSFLNIIVKFQIIVSKVEDLSVNKDFETTPVSDMKDIAWLPRDMVIVFED